MITKIAKDKKFKTDLLFVHGAWHGAWCWKNFMDYFSARGFSTWALELPGHGERAGEPGLWRRTITDYVDEVDRVAKKIGNPVIIGHSMGGFVTMKYLERAKPPAAVLVDPMPFRSIPRLTLLKLSVQYPLTVARLMLLLPVSITSAEMYHRLFFYNSPKSVAEKNFPKVTKESAFAMMGAGLPTVWLRPSRATSPVLVVSGERDYFFPEKAERRTARAYRGDFKLYKNMGHDLMMEQGWRESPRTSSSG